MPDPRIFRSYQARPLYFDRNTYEIWLGMKGRCSDPREARYYGRGIEVCTRWRVSYARFVEDMGIRPKDQWLDRIDNDGNYEPGNCRWATPLVQQNNRSNNVPITALGRTQNVSEWAREFGVGYQTLYRRHQRGEAIELIQALSEGAK